MGKKLIRFDWALKRLLRHKADFVILEGFLSELLREDITIEEILESESNKRVETGKFNRVDVLCKDCKGQLIIIEVQNCRQLDYMQRILYGTSKAVVEHISEGEKYSKVKKIYSVNIVYFDIGQGSDYIYHGTTCFKGVHTHEVLGLNSWQIRHYGDLETYQIFPEYWLLKVNNFDDVAKETLDQWVYFLKNSELPEHVTAKGLKEAGEKLDVMNLPEKERKEYENMQEDLRYQASMFDSSWGDGHLVGFEKGEEKGIKRGREEGRQEERKAIARNLLDVLDNKTIATKTGLTEEEIQKLREE
jgi:predicted transposase/invertase (TIGR01784 family)